MLAHCVLAVWIAKLIGETSMTYSPDVNALRGHGGLTVWIAMLMGKTSMTYGPDFSKAGRCR